MKKITHQLMSHASPSRKILISLPNFDSAFEPAHLLEIDLIQHSVRRIVLDHLEIKGFFGVTGVCFVKGGFLAVFQGNPCRLVVFDKEYNVGKVYVVPDVHDAHSIVSDGEVVYIVSTGTDSIYRLELANDRYSLYWKYNSGDADTIHINAIAIYKERLYVSAFGRKEGKLWSTASNGYVIDLENQNRIFANIYHPHSLVIHRGSFWYIDSSKMKLVRNGRDELIVGGGYIRGLLVDNSFLYVGTSIGRQRSKSTGLPLTDNPADPGERTGLCSLKLFRLKRWHRLADAELSAEYDLSSYAKEIYEIVALKH